MIQPLAQFAGFQRQRNGLYLPPGVVPFIGLGGACCDNNPDGVCCAPDGTCSITKESECTAPSTWSEGGTCDPNPCDPDGVCCHSDKSCTITKESECDGTWTEGGDCDPNPCLDTSPANCASCSVALATDITVDITGGWANDSCNCCTDADGQFVVTNIAPCHWRYVSGSLCDDAFGGHWTIRVEVRVIFASPNYRWTAEIWLSPSGGTSAAYAQFLSAIGTGSNCTSIAAANTIGLTIGTENIQGSACTAGMAVASILL